MRIENPTKAQIEEYLEKIGWSLRHHGCEHYYFYNHKKKCTNMCLLFPNTDARISIEGKNYQNPSVYFYVKDIVMDLLGEDKPNCVSFKGNKNENIFILCPNYSK